MARTRLDPDLRREQILAAAAARFRSQPFADVSLEDVATAAGVTRGLLHHYFGSKRALFLEVVEQAVRVPDDVALVPPGIEGDLADVIGPCVHSWMQLMKATGGLWSGAAGSSAFSDHEVDAVLTQARDALVERMIAELPFPAGLDPDMLRSALRSYAAMARVATHEWLITKDLTEAQAAAMLRSTFLAMVESVVPAMGE